MEEDNEVDSNEDEATDEQATNKKKKFQDTLTCNRFLPYYHSLRKEARELLADIKLNLSQTVQKHELWPGGLFWTNRLTSYIRVYGLHFSKEDHIKFIHLLYELITIPKLECPLLHTWCSILILLLRKPKTLSPSDLTLPWRPLYQVVKDVFKCKYSELGMKIYSTQTCNAIKGVLDNARNYFPLESTQEMLDEWRPMLCPFDLAMVDGMSYLANFLPTRLPPESHHMGHKLWFEELMKLWLDLHYCSSAEESFIKLFVRLAKENIGYIDWTPYLPQIFSRILRSFSLPAGPKQLNCVMSKQYINVASTATFIVSVLGSGSEGQNYLKQLMQSFESFYHPSNLGRETRKLLTFLKEISSKFILRLKNERYKKPQWHNSIPDHAKLTEEDIDAFVQCLLPSLKMAVFSKFGTIDAALTLHNLALVRPEMVLPDLLNSTYTALETLTEPHQVIATLQCVTGISRVLLSGGYGRYPEGKKHLFSLLTHALPGVDSNDFRKTLVSTMVISALVTLVPLVDCSSSIGKESFNMTTEVEELCSLTTHFEGFILLFLDRCFALIENTRLEQVTALDRQVSFGSTDIQESIMGAGISGSVHTILIQCSPHLFKVALEKIFHFATSQVFESEIAGHLCADLCSSASKANSEETLKLFIPHCVNEIDKILEDPYQLDAEHPDHALIWNIQLLSQLLQNVGAPLVKYADDLLICLRKCVHLKSKVASKHAAAAVNSILQSLTVMYPMETRSLAEGFDQSPEEHLYIRDWSTPVVDSEAKIEWHIPSLEELCMADRVLVEILQPELDRLKAFMAGEELEREELNQTLQLVKEIISGVATYLPMWKGAQLEGCPTSVVSLKRKEYITFKLAKSPPEQFSRKSLALFLHKLIDHVMKTREDDTKSMYALVQMCKDLLSFCGVDKHKLDTKWRSFKYSKSVIGDKLRGKKNQVRPLFIARIQLQHELRLTEKSMCTQTQLHHVLLKDLLRMAISEYAHVRIKAQYALSRVLEVYLYAGRKLLPHILPMLSNDEKVSHEQFKGALHVLLICPMMEAYVHDWGMMRDVLPVIVKADHSEKPSIQKLMSRLASDIVKRYDYFSLEFKVSEGSVARATDLHDALPDSEREKGRDLSDSLTRSSLENYREVVITLVQLIEEGKLQWKFSQMAISFIVMLIRHDHPLPTEAVKLLTHSLVHDALVVRKMAISAMKYILQQQKRKYKKVPVDILKEAGVSSLSSDLPPGQKKENAWLCYDPNSFPETREKWEEFKFIDKTFWGYYTYPKVLMTYAPYQDQPSLSRLPSELSESERVIYDSFSSEEFVEKLVSYLSLEEVKGRDHFDNHKFIFLKFLFRNFGTAFLSLFKPHIEKMCLDSHENNQRFACEIIGAIVRGSKNWSFPMVQEMKDFLEPLLSKSMDAITPETISDWATCMSNISADRDPRRIHWLLELFMKNPLSGENGSFNDSSRLYLLQSILAQQEWRVGHLLFRLVDYLQPHLTHTYKNVRERIGSVLSQIYYFDIFIVDGMKLTPRREDMVQFVLQKMPTLDQLPSLTEDETTLKHCKTCLMWLFTMTNYDPDIFQVFSALLPLVTVENDDEVSKLVKAVCARIAQVELSVRAVPAAISALQKAMDTGLWKVRVTALQLLQVLIFKNLFLFIPHVQLVTDLLVSHCENPQIEVRELAASSIGGLVRCGYINSIDELKAHFIRQSRSKLPKKNSSPSPDNGYESALTKLHSGVLGLGALVEACPYSVPEWLPDILDELALHLHDPAPIPGSVRKTMSEFKRTHHDSWSEHKLKFTDDQLTVLADLLVSPSYYA